MTEDQTPWVLLYQPLPPDHPERCWYCGLTIASHKTYPPETSDGDDGGIVVTCVVNVITHNARKLGVVSSD